MSTTTGNWAINSQEHKSWGEVPSQHRREPKTAQFSARLSCSAVRTPRRILLCQYYNPFSSEDGCGLPHPAHPIYLYHRRWPAPNYPDPVSLKTAQFSPALSDDLQFEAKETKPKDNN